MNRINREKFEAHLFVVNAKGPLKSILDTDITITDIGCSSQIKALWPLYKALQEFNPDIVFSTMAQMNFMALMLKPFFLPTAFIVREAITPSFLFKKYKQVSYLLKMAYATLYRMANLILAPAQIINDELGQILKSKNTHFQVLPNPVDLNRLYKAKYPQPTTKPDTVNFICAGRLHKQKGFDRLIESLGRNKNKFNHRWFLKILGEGAERAHLESLVKQNGLGNNISLEGFVEDYGAHYAAADYFLLPSRYEGLPNVVLEALACATPVMSMEEAGGIAEIQAAMPENHKQHLTIYDDIDNFTLAMSVIEPQTSPKALFENSFLPECYKYENVVKNLEEIFLNALKKKST